jgi:NADH-quinone oxidoreductase subunit L
LKLAEAARLVGWLPLIPLLPFLGFLLNGTLGRRLGKRFVSFVGVAAPLAGFALVLAAFLALHVEDGLTVVTNVKNGGHRMRVMAELHGMPVVSTPEDVAHEVIRVRASVDEVRTRTMALGVNVVASSQLGPRSWHGPAVRESGIVKDIPWIAFGKFQIPFRFVFDRLSGLLCLVVLGVGTLIHVYSIGYMDTEDRGGFARYFAYLNLFTAMMLVLALAGDAILMFVGWEGVGLASYLLIGFDYREGWKADAGIKAFVVNRVGDLGFILGIVALGTAAVAAGPYPDGFGMVDLRFDHLNQLALDGKVAPMTLGIAALCLFLGATGKSAQLPLYVWLPDAMAGPTPVSALIHAATMVTAGVYMVCRLHPVFELAVVGGIPVLGIVAAIGALTAIFAATAAIGQDDVKKVLAYSTVSQLGYMFLGAGVGAFGGAVFHLTTHAFFKALLFLGSGSLIHATGTQDLKKMGGLKRVLPTTYWTMTVGAAALAGVPLLSGFFSKDMILGHALEKATAHGASPAWFLVYAVGVIGGFITAFYSTRLIAMAFYGPEGETAKHAHESPPVMTGPLVVLAALSVLGGLLGLPGLLPEWSALALPRFLQPILAPAAELTAEAAHAVHGAAAHEAAHGSAKIELLAILISSAAAIAGVLLGRSYYLLGKMPESVRLAEEGKGSLAGLRGLLTQAWRVDEAYRRFIAEPVLDFSKTLWKLADDALLDRGIVDGFGRIARGMGELVTAFQTGRVARYAAYVAVGAVALLVASAL